MNSHKKSLLRLALTTVMLGLGCATAPAEDIDLFNVTPGLDPNGPKPNVLFVLDNSANWDATLYTDANGNKISKKQAIHEALYRLAADSGVKQDIRIGIMTLAQSNNPPGGVLLHAISDLNTTVRNPTGTITRPNDEHLRNKILGPGIITATKDSGLPFTPNDTYWADTDTRTPYWCNNWVAVDWKNFRPNADPLYDKIADIAIYRMVNGVKLAGDDCYIPYPSALVDGTGRGNVTTDAAGNVSLSVFPAGPIWDNTSGDTGDGRQAHWYLDPADASLVYYGLESTWATLKPTLHTDPMLPYISDKDGSIQSVTLSQVISAGTPRIPKANNKPFAQMMHEAYLYLNGGTVRSGRDLKWYDESDNKGADNWQWLDIKTSNWTSAFSSSTQYRSPVNDDNACARSFIIFIGNGSGDVADDSKAEPLLRALNGVLTSDPIPLTPNNNESNWADEYARFLHARDFTATQTETQNATTYVVDVFDPAQIKTNVDLAARAFLKSIATQGHGRYFEASSSDAIFNSIKQSLLEILATNSVFASTTLPVSVNVRGTNLNQVYMGVFRPDESWLPRWMGNLKLYQLATDVDGSIFLADANGNKAEDSANGFLVDDAESYWTFDEATDFWDFNSTTYPNPSDLPDGKNVEKGAAAQRIRKDVIEHVAAGGSYDTSRGLYTCASSDPSCSSPVAFTDANVGAELGVVTATDGYTSSELIDWVYGKKKAGDATSIEGTRQVRASVHGDVLHSRPAVIGYNVNDENDVIAYYGANDGIFHAVKGGKTSDGTILDGHERWGFIFPEFLPELKKLYDNQQIDTDPASATYNPRPYFADGSIGILREPASGNPDYVHLFVSMRRGGRFLYALDVSPSTPGSGQLPTNFSVLWKKSNTQYGELGQTWSEPKVATLKVANTGSVATDYKKVIIFGGGYDPDFDDVYPRDLAKADSGRDIFVLDAADGSLIWKASTDIGNGVNNFVQQYPIPSDVGVIDLDGDGDVDRLYVGDTGGNVWRVNIDDITTPANWPVNKLASVGTDHKFLYAPDVVRLDNGNLAVLIGSGNREDPRNKNMPVGHLDRFYMFQDTGSTTGITEASMANVANGDTVDLATKPGGWYLVLQEGEKVVSNAVTLNGVTFFNTSQVVNPTGTTPISCSGSLGTARSYHISYKDASVPEGYEDLSDEVPGGGLPPSPVAVIVELDGKKVEAVVSGTSVQTPPGSQLDLRQKRYWFEEVD